MTATPTPEMIREALPLMTPLERIEWSALVKAMNASRLKTVGEDIVLEALFDKEKGLAEDPHRFITACCGRRAGKTYTVAAMMLRTAKKYARRTVLYLHLTRDGAKGIIWPTLKLLNDFFGLGGQPNESDLTMTMPNGAVIVLRGVDKRKEIEKRRGYGFALVIIDECQSIPEYVRNLVDDVIGPALADVPGRLVMIGTPSMLEAGYWHECHHNENPVWGHHFWTMWDNPHIPDPDVAFAQECARRGVDAENVSMQREWKGRWIRDDSSAVFAFSVEANTFEQLPIELARELYRYVIAVDIGGGVQRDNDAIGAFAYHPHSRATWLIKEEVCAKDDVTGLAEKVKAMRSDLGADKVVAIVADTGGIGAKVVEEMSRRHGLSVEAAKKKDKWANIELLNAACRHGEFFAFKGSKFAEQAPKVEKDWDKSTPDRIAIKGHMPDVCDMTLYGFVESYSWVSKAPSKAPRFGSKEWADSQAKAMFEKAQRDVKAAKQSNGGEWGTDLAVDDWGGGGMEWGS